MSSAGKQTVQSVVQCSDLLIGRGAPRRMADTKLPDEQQKMYSTLCDVPRGFECKRTTQPGILWMC
jgi:hypothetical protein